MGSLFPDYLVKTDPTAKNTLKVNLEGIRTTDCPSRVSSKEHGRYKDNQTADCPTDRPSRLEKPNQRWSRQTDKTDNAMTENIK